MPLAPHQDPDLDHFFCLLECFSVHNFWSKSALVFTKPNFHLDLITPKLFLHALRSYSATAVKSKIIFYFKTLYFPDLKSLIATLLSLCSYPYCMLLTRVLASWFRLSTRYTTSLASPLTSLTLCSPVCKLKLERIAPGSKSPWDPEMWQVQDIIVYNLCLNFNLCRIWNTLNYKKE